MKHLPSFIICLWWFLIIGCQERNVVEAEELNIDDESLMDWTSDNILSANRPLVLLMDTLYRYVSSGETSDMNTDTYFAWMSDYRKQLVDYYDRLSNDRDTLSEFDKASAVIEMADTLWSLDKDYSTMGIVDNDGIKFTRTTFTNYNEYARLSDLCHSQKGCELLRNEYETWVNLEGIVSAIVSKLIDLKYYGGSIYSVINGTARLKMFDIHISLYRKENKWLSKKDCSFETEGAFDSCTKDLLIDCCKLAVQNNICDDYEIEYEGDQKEYYKTLPDICSRLIGELPEAINNWLEARNEWIDEVCTDNTKICYQLNSGEVLIRLANIISAI